MLSLLLSKAGLTLVGVGLVVAVILTQSLRLAHAKSDLSAARASLAASETRLKTSESNRAAEYGLAKKAVSDAENACSARVAEALKSGAVIKRIVTRVPVLDAKGCPQRSLVPASELRAAVQP